MITAHNQHAYVHNNVESWTFGRHLIEAEHVAGELVVSMWIIANNGEVSKITRIDLVKSTVARFKPYLNDGRLLSRCNYSISL